LLLEPFHDNHSLITHPIHSNGKDVTSTTWTAVIKLIQTGEEVLLKLAPSGSLFRRPLV